MAVISSPYVYIALTFGYAELAASNTQLRQYS